MPNTTATTPVEPTQTETDVHHLMNAIVSNLAVSGQPMPSSGVIRVEAALHTVLSRRDQEAAELVASRQRVRELEAALSSISLITSGPAYKGRGIDEDEVEQIENLTRV